MLSPCTFTLSACVICQSYILPRVLPFDRALFQQTQRFLLWRILMLQYIFHPRVPHHSLGSYQAHLNHLPLLVIAFLGSCFVGYFDFAPFSTWVLVSRASNNLRPSAPTHHFHITPQFFFSLCGNPLSNGCHSNGRHKNVALSSLDYLTFCLVNYAPTAYLGCYGQILDHVLKRPSPCPIFSEVLCSLNF